jgi:putative transposase
MQELSGVSEAARELAMSRFRLIQPHLEANRPLQLVAADGKLPFRTAQRWVSQYRKFGLIALVRKSRNDRGARRVVSPKIKAAIEALALESPPLPVRSICRQVRQFAERIGEPLPRYGTVYDLVRDIPVGLLTLAHLGGKAYSEEFDLVHRREAPRSNAIGQADHAQLSIRLVREDGQIARPWLTIVIDDFSRAIAGYYLDVTFQAPSGARAAELPVSRLFVFHSDSSGLGHIAQRHNRSPKTARVPVTSGDQIQDATRRGFAGSPQRLALI